MVQPHRDVSINSALQAKAISLTGKRGTVPTEPASISVPAVVLYDKRKGNMTAVVQVEVTRPVCVEVYSECKDLGRFMLRNSGTTVAAGVVTKAIM